MKTEFFRVYRQVVSKNVRKDGMRLVKRYGCNGVEHRIQYYHIACDEKGRKAVDGRSCVKPDKILGPCKHDFCRNYGFFMPDDWKPGVRKTEGGES